MTTVLPVAIVRKVAHETTLTAGDEGVLRALSQSNLRPNDEVVLLPGAYHSTESMSVKNVVVRLDGDHASIPSRLFSSWWCHGISAVRLPHLAGEGVMDRIGGKSQRSDLLSKLCAAIPNEVTDRNTTVGPSLAVDDDDRDCEEWTAGFDTKNCCIGLYACDEERQSNGAPPGTQRAHRQYYLVCKAGAGRAAQEFSRKIEQASRDHKSLNEALGPNGSPGEEMLRRVALAGRRNRARLILKAAQVLGVEDDIDSVLDHAGHREGTQKHAILDVDVHCNTLLPTKGGARTDWIYHSGCVPTTSAQGLICANTANLGFVMMHVPSNESSTTSAMMVTNEAYNSLPFSTPRRAATNEVLRMACKSEHPDNSWIERRFAWKNVANRFANTRADEQAFTHRVAKVEPPQLWGTHFPETWVQTSSRELGVSTYCATKLRPELVVLAGTEPEKMRTLMRSITRGDAQ
jgi:hypothetical protein